MLQTNVEKIKQPDSCFPNFISLGPEWVVGLSLFLRQVDLMTGDMKGPPDSQFTVLSLSFQVCLVLLREVTVYSGVSGPPPKTQNARCPFGDLTARTLFSV